LDWFAPIASGLLVATAVYFAWSTFEASQNAQKRGFPAKADSASRSFGKLGRNTAFVLICILISICWVAWPYYAAYDLAKAFRDGDSVALENRVAWDSVRQSLRADLNAILLRDVGSNNLAAVLGPAIINQMIEGYITPQGVANLMRSGTASTSVSASEQRRQLDFSRLKYAFFSGNLLTFKVEIENVNKGYSNPFIWIMRWNGTWKLTRLVLPAGIFPDHTDARPALSTQNSPRHRSGNLPQPSKSLFSKRVSKTLVHKIPILRTI